ncbi:MAG TPA: hypothetical protein VGK54_01745 [Chloroflexota bacterium]
MHSSVVRWLNKEFVALSCEGRPAGSVAEETGEAFGRIEEELYALDLSLANTVRTRLWAHDRSSRDEGSKQRAQTLTGLARSASSSFIAPHFFESEGRVAIELLALRPADGAARKLAAEYDPPIVPARYCSYDGLVFLSGVTAVLPTLAEQLADILPRITESLRDAGSSWGKVERVSCYLHRSQSLAELQQLLAHQVDADIPQVEFGFVDGYSTEGKLIEIETTARL